jgi:hypothetical protein
MSVRSSNTETIPDAIPASWSDAGIEPVTAGERLAPEQPECGLLWVTRGSLTLTRGGRVHEVRKGTVIAYRLGGGLAWSAPDGTHVRWCARDVSVGAGHVAPWTSELVLDGPVPPPQRRRASYIVATVALAWAFAIGVAWCYDNAHARQYQAALGTLAGASSPTIPDREEVEAAQAIFFQHLDEVPTLHETSSRGHLVLVMALPPLKERPGRLNAARAAADETYRRCPSFRKILIAFGPPGPLPSELGRYFLMERDRPPLDMRAGLAPSAATLESSAAARPPR